MTLLARGRKAGVRHWAGRAGEIFLVTRNAGRHSDVVVVGAVAVGAGPGRHGVRSGQWKCGFGVVEGRRLPGRSRVAEFAGLGESTRHVIRIRRALKIGEMAGHARRAGDVVVAKLRVVAIRALPRRNGVHAGQRESRGVVIEGGVGPRNRAVALLASLRKVCQDMIRIRRSLKIF